MSAQRCRAPVTFHARVLTTTDRSGSGCTADSRSARQRFLPIDVRVRARRWGPPGYGNVSIWPLIGNDITKTTRFDPSTSVRRILKRRDASNSARVLAVPSCSSVFSDADHRPHHWEYTMTDQLSGRASTEPPVSPTAVGFTAFAAVVMIMTGAFQGFQGLVALLTTTSTWSERNGPSPSTSRRGVGCI